MNASPEIIKANDVIVDLIHRARATPGSEPDWDSSLSGRTDEQLLTQLEVFLVQLSQKPALNLSHGTTLACTKCGRLEALAYYLKRSHSRYAVPCFDNDKGCWECFSHATFAIVSTRLVLRIESILCGCLQPGMHWTQFSRF